MLDPSRRFALSSRVCGILALVAASACSSSHPPSGSPGTGGGVTGSAGSATGGAAGGNVAGTGGSTGGAAGMACANPPVVVGNLNLQWALALGNGEMGGVAVDADGNTILTGDYLGSLTVGGQTLTPEGGVDGYFHPFVVALDPAGRLRWWRTLPGVWVAAGVGLDAAGNIYIAGSSFDTTLDLGNGPLPGSLVIAKLGPSGRTIWSRSFEAYRDSDLGSLGSTLAIAADATGAVAVMGAALVPVDFGGGAPAPTDGLLGFLAVFDTSGAYRLSKSFVSDGVTAALAFDESGNLLFGGDLQGSLDLDGVTLSGGSAGTGFAALLDATGATRWARAFGDGSRTTAVATGGGVNFAAGTFDQQITAAGRSTTTVGLDDLFLLADDAQRGMTNLTTTAAAVDRVGALAPAGDGGAVALVEIGDVVDLGTGLIARPGLALLRTDRVGRTVASAAFDAPYGSHAAGVAVDRGGGIVVFGSFASAIDLGAGLLTGMDSFAQTLFVARFAQDPAAPARDAAPCPPLVADAALSGPTGTGSPKASLLHGGTLYYTTGTEVMSLPVAGGAPAVLATGQRNVVALAADDQRLYWAATGHNPYLGPPNDGQIVSMPLAGGAPSVLAAGQPVPSAIAVDEINVYWTAGGVPTNGSSAPPTDGQVLALPKAGGAAATVLVGNLGPPGPIAAANGSVAYAVSMASGPSTPNSSQISAVPRGGGQPVLLATTNHLVSSMTTDGATIFWTDASTLGVDSSRDDGRVAAVPLAGGAVTILADLQSVPVDIVLVGDEVYWANVGGFSNGNSTHKGGVWRAPKAGGQAQSIVSGQTVVRAFTADAAHAAYVLGTDPANSSWALFVRSR